MEPHVLPLKTVRNPRDLGGYVGYDGHKIKSHRLLRTGKMSGMSKQDRQFLLDYGLVNVVDLRSPKECKAAPDDELPGVKHFNLSVSDEDNTQGGRADLARMWQLYHEDQYAGFEMMCQRYHDHVVHRHAQHTFHRLLELLANTKEGATIFHCSEGKDRTGLAVVFILSVLGVSEETIRQDYLYSNYMLNDYRAERDLELSRKDHNLKLRANMRILGSVCDAFLDTSLLLIKEEYGGMEEYLKNQLGVTPMLRDTLRELYLEA